MEGFNAEIHEKLLDENGEERGYQLKQVSQALPPVRHITKGSFYSRLEMDEKLAIETSTDPMVKVFTKSLDYSSHVDLDYQETVDGLNYLVPNLLTAERVAVILRDGEPHEAYHGG